MFLLNISNKLRWKFVCVTWEKLLVRKHCLLVCRSNKIVIDRTGAAFSTNVRLQSTVPNKSQIPASICSSVCLLLIVLLTHEIIFYWAKNENKIICIVLLHLHNRIYLFSKSLYSCRQSNEYTQLQSA